MKRAIIALSILCTGALAINPIKDISFAQNTNGNTNKEVVQNIETNTSENLNIEKNKNIEANKEVEKTEVTKKEIAKDETLKNEEKELVTNKEEIANPQKNEQDTKQPVVEKNEAVVENKKEDEKTDKNTVEVIEVLNQEQAKELLKMVNPDMNYIYQGDETTFEALSQKGLSGYVFLPDVDGDMGLFVDKNTANVYYFHPSGYLELAL